LQPYATRKTRQGKHGLDGHNNPHPYHLIAVVLPHIRGGTHGKVLGSHYTDVVAVSSPVRPLKTRITGGFTFMEAIYGSVIPFFEIGTRNIERADRFY
jgi:hypothetical protein